MSEVSFASYFFIVWILVHFSYIPQIVEKKTSQAFEKLLSSINERFKLNDPTITQCVDRLNGISESIIYENGLYHSECYKNITNVAKIRRLSSKYTEPNVDIEIHEESELLEEDSKDQNRDIYDKSFCIICQKEGGKLRKVEYLETGKKMYEVAKSASNKTFFFRFNTIPQADDAVANDVVYHLQCWVSTQREIQTKQEIQEIHDVNRIIADNEIVDIVQTNSHNENVTDMNTINKTYNDLVGNEVEVNYKRYLKTLLQENISGLTFSRPPSRRMSENVLTVAKIV